MQLDPTGRRNAKCASGRAHTFLQRLGRPRTSFGFVWFSGHDVIDRRYRSGGWTCAVVDATDAGVGVPGFRPFAILAAAHRHIPPSEGNML